MADYREDIRLGKELSEQYRDHLPDGVEEKMMVFFRGEEGHFHYRRGELRKADDSFKALIAYLHEHQPNDSTTLGRSYDHLGLIHGQQNNFATSLSFFEKARDYITVKQRGTSYEALAYQHAAVAHSNLEQNSKAEAFFRCLCNCSESKVLKIGNNAIATRQASEHTQGSF